MPRKTKAQKEAEQLQIQKDREAEYHPRLFKALEKCSEFGWRFFVKDGFFDFRSYHGWESYEEYTSVESVPYDPAHRDSWTLGLLEDALAKHQEGLDEEERKNKLKKEAWSKLTPDEREALGMRRE